MSNTAIRVITESKEFESLSEVWDSLLQKSNDDNAIYLTYEWVSTWWKHFGEGKKLNILLIENQGQVIGIVPLMKTEYSIGLVKSHLLETIGSVNCNYIGLMPLENRDEAVVAFLDYLRRELGRSKLSLRLTLVPDDSKFLDMLRRHAPTFSKNLVMQETIKTLAPYIPLPATWDVYYRSLSQNRRWVLRKKLRFLEEEHSVEFQECTIDTPEDRLSKFFDIHQRRWQSANVSGVFSNPKMKEFYRDIASQFLKKGWLHFSYLNVDGEMASAEYAFVYNGKFYGATTARDIRYSKYSIGHLHLMFLIKDAIRKGLREFDLLKGDEPYKFHWTKSARKYMQIVIIKKGLCPGIRLKLLRAFLRLCEIRPYSLREIYFIYLIKRKDKEEKKRMGLKTFS